MKVEIGFEETNEVETLCNVEYIEPRDGAVYVEFENPAESDDPYAVTEFDSRGPYIEYSRGPYIESVQRDEHDWFGAEDQQS